MLFLRLRSLGEDEVVYDYMPGGEDADPGMISLDLGSGLPTLVKRFADDDMPWYLGQALYRIERMRDEGHFAEFVQVAWY
ncbi:MAG: hypothetical protein LKE37_01515 [Atopobiaceae bacterium]|jgi:hypothetical protein|nr:hypothetical protein [Atopobiaceae bacterium]